MANPTADWEKVGDRFYRKTQLYTAVFDQDLELENYILTGAVYGGAIGTLLLFPLSLLVPFQVSLFLFSNSHVIPISQVLPQLLLFVGCMAIIIRTILTSVLSFVPRRN